MDRVSYKTTAKQQLVGNWGALILMCFIFNLFFGGANAINIRFGSGADTPTYILTSIANKELITVILFSVFFLVSFYVFIIPSFAWCIDDWSIKISC